MRLEQVTFLASQLDLFDPEQLLAALDQLEDDIKYSSGDEPPTGYGRDHFD